ncbi:hypothetical protein NP233_g9987 [Leucocoprinus birnbaumii]|uniref:Uncharacterized protein n=1 Tax=Leucocoprinus birnbaumii TaxID=56174 RepID=A0AAD5YQC0_9AGAR|nr:hypothetical protein NP233_g9987 [Leucocoprinus birnbaumii]
MSVQWQMDKLPIEGCLFGGPGPPPLIEIVHAKAVSIWNGIRAGSVLIESILTFVKFIIMCQDTRAAGSTIHEHISHIRTFTPLLYVFYRDGTLFFIPVLGESGGCKVQNDSLAASWEEGAGTCCREERRPVWGGRSQVGPGWRLGLKEAVADVDELVNVDRRFCEHHDRSTRNRGKDEVSRPDNLPHATFVSFPLLALIPDDIPSLLAGLISETVYAASRIPLAVLHTAAVINRLLQAPRSMTAVAASHQFIITLELKISSVSLTSQLHCNLVAQGSPNSIKSDPIGS